MKRHSGLAWLWFPLLASLAWSCSGNNASSPSAPAILTFSSGGNYPEGIGIDKSDNVWIANRYSRQVAELSNAGALINTFAVGVEPHGLKIDRANSQNIWVQNVAGGGPGAPASCPNNTSGTVTALAADGSLIGTFCTGGTGPQHAQFDSSGNIWVTNQGSNTVSELSGAGTFINTFQTGTNPHAIARDQSGNFWIGNYYSGTVTVLKPDGSFYAAIDNVGLQPTGNDIDPSGSLWQSVQSLNAVAVFAAPPSFAPIRSESVGFAPRGVTIDNAGNVFVANRQSNDVLEFNSSGTQVNQFQVGACPENMAIDSKGDLWVSNSCSSTVSVIKGVAVPSPNGDDDSNG
jgi:streptogramin lyase